MGEPRAKLEVWSKTFGQEADCCDMEYQNLILEQHDGGGGAYWTLNSQRWAIDSIDEFVELLRSAGVAETAPPAET